MISKTKKIKKLAISFVIASSVSSSYASSFTEEQRYKLITEIIPNGISETPYETDPITKNCFQQAINGSDKLLGSMYLIAESARFTKEASEKRMKILSDGGSVNEIYRKLKGQFDLSNLNKIRFINSKLPMSIQACQKSYLNVYGKEAFDDLVNN